MADFRQSRRNWTSEVAEGLVDTSQSIFIAVMGVTGAGKSSFISLCSNEAVEVGHDLTAHTSKVDVYSFRYNSSTTVYLIDTPGFDDTSRSDTEVLQDLAAFLTKSYVKKVKLNGIIYLHRITDVRMQGSAKKNLMMFKKLCGKDALQNVILATTMWSLVEQKTGEDREAQLLSTPEFWGWMKDQGSSVRRHEGDRRSAVEIIDHFVEQNVPITLDIQEQMVNQHRNLDETSAGLELQTELLKEREKFQADLQQIQQDMEEAIRERDEHAEEILKEVRDDYMNKIGELSRQGEELKISMQQLHEANYNELRDRMINQVEAHRRHLERATGSDIFHSFPAPQRAEGDEGPRRSLPATGSSTESASVFQSETPSSKREDRYSFPDPEWPSVTKAPIKFKDSVGRKFTFPFHLCSTWHGMEELIKQAFLHVEVIGPHVQSGHYDLISPNGEIILPQVWELMLEPGWAITMHMWPMPEPKKLLPVPLPASWRVPPPPPIVTTSSNRTPTSKKRSSDTQKGMLGWMAGAPSKPSSSKKY